MGRETKKSEPIDGFIYEVTQLPAKEGKKIGSKVLGLFLEAGGALASGGGEKTEAESVLDLDLGAWGVEAGARVVSEKMLSPDLDWIWDAMAGSTAVFGEGFGDAGAPLDRNFDDHFAGRYDSMVAWFQFALEANFKGFFGGLWKKSRAMFPKLQELNEVVSNLQKGSTGKSGGSSLRESLR